MPPPPSMPGLPMITDAVWKSLGELPVDQISVEKLAELAKSMNVTVRQLLNGLIAGTGNAGAVAEKARAAIQVLGGPGTIVARAAVLSGGAAAGAAAATEVVEVASTAGTAVRTVGWIARLAAALGISTGALLTGLVLGTIVIAGGAIYYTSRGSDSTTPPGGEDSGGSGGAIVASTGTPAAISPTAANTCAPVVKTARLCPWSPKNAFADVCGPGFCWDGGFNGSLACKQEVLPANAGRNDTNGAKCNAGYTAQSDICTGVITACVK